MVKRRGDRNGPSIQNNCSHAAGRGVLVAARVACVATLLVACRVACVAAVAVPE
jgi:hypothetical protein